MTNNIDYPSPLTRHNPIDCKIGLALSGGGSRAIAFHLGCLRALNKKEILPNINVISAVSGGSLIGALYAYSEDNFEIFDKKIVQILRTGLQKDILTEFFLSAAWAKELGQYLYSFPISLLYRLTDSKRRIMRKSYRTTSFIETLKKKYFHNLLLTDKRRNNLDVIFNSTELRTGTTMRFGSDESGCWPFGTLADNGIHLAEAIALSAAYPTFFPALDKVYKFYKEGEISYHRLILTDGGVYDNLGISCMEPNQNPIYRNNVYKPAYIICCNAGFGLPEGNYIPFGLATRLNQVFNTTMRKAQDSTMKELYLYKKLDVIKGFVLPYLGQNDNSLPYTPQNFVTKSEVNYPTNFSPMKDYYIDKICLRGEQLTTILIDHYCPELMSL